MSDSKSIPLTDEVATELAGINREIQKLQQIGNAVIFGFRSARGVPREWLFDGQKFVPPPPKDDKKVEEVGKSIEDKMKG